MGGAFYGYVVGSITSMVANSDLNASAYYDRMDLIHAWLQHHKLPMAKKRFVRRYFKDFLTSKSAVSEADIWHDLSPELQKSVGEYIVHDNVKFNPLFDGLALGTVVRLQSILRRISVPTGHDVTHAGEVGTAMYIIINGTATLERDPNPTGEAPMLIGAGECFGEEILLGIMEAYEYRVTVMEKCQFEMLLEEDLLALFASMPNVIDRMRMNAFELHPEWEKP